MSELKGKVAVVTGASKGIGAGIAKSLAAEGASVVVNYSSSKEGADRVVAAITKQGGKAIAVQGDVSKAADVQRLFKETKKAFGSLDVLVNNAGVYLAHPVTATSYEEWQDAWRTTLGVNLTGAANATWCAVRHMKERGGRIVNVGSRGAFRGEPAHPAYGASKAGLHAFGQSLAVALAPHGITVASVAPGYVATDMTVEELATPEGDLIRAQSPFDRVALPEEVAAAVVYLASPEAAWASGAVLDLNGASYLR
jgi:3-oxoacyl-[acyl-carrier protein] reductase